MCYKGHLGSLGWSSTASPQIIKLIQLRNELCQKIIDHNIKVIQEDKYGHAPLDKAFEQLDKLLMKLDMESYTDTAQMALPLT